MFARVYRAAASSGAVGANRSRWFELTRGVSRRAFPSRIPPVSMAAPQLMHALSHECFQLDRRQRLTKVVSLRFVAPLLAQECELGWCFYALCGGAIALCLRHADDGANDGAIVTVFAQIAHK